MIFAIPPLVAEPIFHLGNFAVTNTYINSSLAVVFFFIVGLMLRNKTSMIPTGISRILPKGVFWNLSLGYIDRVTHDRKKSMQFLPIVGGIFLFILFSNWVGLIPGTGSIGRHLVVDGQVELVPLFRPANTDLNTTLAMALFAVVASHLFGVIAIGFFRYANKFVKLGDIFHSFRKGGVSIMVAFIEFGVGLIEIFPKWPKSCRCRLRLFGNVFAGEVLMTVLASLIAFLVPLPFMFLEILVGLVQAVVFSMLTLVYLTMATAEIHEHGSDEKHLEATPTH
jgi:F-type H+-transporting ATPase subunit a